MPLAVATITITAIWIIISFCYRHRDNAADGDGNCNDDNDCDEYGNNDNKYDCDGGDGDSDGRLRQVTGETRRYYFYSIAISWLEQGWSGVFYSWDHFSILICMLVAHFGVVGNSAFRYWRGEPPRLTSRFFISP